MNERIRELAEQAGLKYHNWITNESNINDDTFPYPRLEDYEKFAELIVRECCGAANEWYQKHNELHWDPAQHIRNHFGVEE